MSVNCRMEYVAHQKSTNVSIWMEPTPVTAVWSMDFITIPIIGPVPEVGQIHSHIYGIQAIRVSPSNQHTLNEHIFDKQDVFCHKWYFPPLKSGHLSQCRHYTCTYIYAY